MLLEFYVSWLINFFKFFKLRKHNSKKSKYDKNNLKYFDLKLIR